MSALESLYGNKDISTIEPEASYFDALGETITIYEQPKNMESTGTKLWETVRIYDR